MVGGRTGMITDPDKFSEERGSGKENKLQPVRLFVLYSLPRTFLTRLGESGCDAGTLNRIAGHSSSVSLHGMSIRPMTRC